MEYVTFFLLFCAAVHLPTFLSLVQPLIFQGPTLSTFEFDVAPI
jgi:hypothetical protein